MKTTKLFSRPLFGQNMRTYWFFVLAVVLIMSMMSGVVTIAIDAIQSELAGDLNGEMLEKMGKMGLEIPHMDPSVILDTMYYKVIVPLARDEIRASGKRRQSACTLPRRTRFDKKQPLRRQIGRRAVRIYGYGNRNRRQSNKH